MRGARVAVLVLCALSLVWLGHRSTRFALTRPGGIRAALEDPFAYDGQDITLLMWRVQAVPSPGRAVLARRGTTVEVHTDTTALRPGAEVTVRGAFRAEGHTIDADRLTVHRWRTAKRALGLLGTVLALAVLPLGFRVQDGRLVERG